MQVELVKLNTTGVSRVVLQRHEMAMTHIDWPHD